MARRLGVVGGVLCVLALAISIIAPAVADRRNETERFTVLDRAADDEQNISFIDVGGHDFTVGDYFVIELDPLFNRSDTRRVADSSAGGRLPWRPLSSSLRRRSPE